ncbi:transposase [Nocardiopsis sp. CNR-923]|uniref:transposase n=1 Tax=Nocardiopsis sp. CNR-923 TaxID=1904965 RepID=UPI0009650BAE|nr:transposase [Nocardiopsis sp. CNR-923]OLT25603.1 transposase [Nocardiopsis sp. CNR-923]
MTSKSTDPAARPKRRTFPADYKLRTVAEYDACTTGTERGALLRRERLYHSHIAEWRTARDSGALKALTDRRTSAARTKKHPAQAEAERLRARIERLEKELAERDHALEVMGKASALLQALSKSAD